MLCIFNLKKTRAKWIWQRYLYISISYLISVSAKFILNIFKNSRKDILEKRDKFLETQNLPRLNHDERENLNGQLVLKR